MVPGAGGELLRGAREPTLQAFRRPFTEFLAKQQSLDDTSCGRIVVLGMRGHGGRSRSGGRKRVRVRNEIATGLQRCSEGVPKRRTSKSGKVLTGDRLAPGANRWVRSGILAGGSMRTLLTRIPG